MQYCIMANTFLFDSLHFYGSFLIWKAEKIPEIAGRLVDCSSKRDSMQKQ